MSDEQEQESDALPGAGSPEGQILQDAHEAFERGDYVSVRELTTKLETTSDKDVANAALALRNRTSVDPAQIAILAACVLFFMFIVWKYVL